MFFDILSDVRKSAGWVVEMSKNLDRSILGFEGLVSYMQVSYMPGGCILIDRSK